MTETEKIQQVAEKLGTALSDDSPSFDVRESLRDWLANRVFDLMQHDRARFFNLMYRLDVREEQLRAALKQPDLYAQVLTVAELMIDRELERMYWREKYS